MELSFQIAETDARNELDREIPYHFFVFDVLRYFDIPDFLVMSGIKGTVIAPINGDWEPLSRELSEQLLPDDVIYWGQAPIISLNTDEN